MAFKIFCKSILRKFLKAASALRLIPRRLIISMDGGICSQMHFYLVGRYLEKKYNCTVNFDTTWFDKCGVDLEGKHKRNFELLKIFPDLNFKEENRGLFRKTAISFFYKTGTLDLSRINNQDENTLRPPAFLSCYFSDTYFLIKEKFSKTFKVNIDLLPQDNSEIKKKISDKKRDACAIHVRRGDLSKSHKVYGDPCEATYFINSIRYLKKLNNDIGFFIFSDDSDWFKTQVMPKVSDEEIIIVEVNDSSRAWCDLILMSLCRYQITSQGSMGKYASLLRNDKDKDGIVVLPQNESSSEWKKCFEKSIIIG